MYSVWPSVALAAVNIKEAKQPSYRTEDTWLILYVCLCYLLVVMYPPKAQTLALGYVYVVCVPCCVPCEVRIRGYMKNSTVEWAAMRWISVGWGEIKHGDCCYLVQLLGPRGIAWRLLNKLHGKLSVKYMYELVTKNQRMSGQLMGQVGTRSRSHYDEFSDGCRNKK